MEIIVPASLGPISRNLRDRCSMEVGEEEGPLSESCGTWTWAPPLDYHLSLLCSAAGGSGAATSPDSPGRQLLRVLQLLT